MFIFSYIDVTYAAETSTYITNAKRSHEVIQPRSNLLSIAPPCDPRFGDPRNPSLP